ncbi:outer membrane protein transport protein [Gammaproteobacteria bacterium]|nr:outer membrane protein transport protein [Gammaproteobacteria bacterium]
MKNKQFLKVLFCMLIFFNIYIFSNKLFAAAFQLWQQDGASIGNYHAGRAAIAEDASTAFYNPAGLVRFKNQQIVLGVSPITTDISFDGAIAVQKIDNFAKHSAVSQGGSLNFVPNFSYVAPVFDNLVFGLSVNVPFGLQTDYGYNSISRYVATKTSLNVIDISPVLSFSITNKLSIGLGPDIEYSNANLNFVASVLDTNFDSYTTNSLSGSGFGLHAGLLFQFNPDSRLGFSYHSKVIHNLNGTSKLIGPGDIQNNKNLKTSIVMPSTTTLSFYSGNHRRWDMMATVNYTQWNVVKNIILYNVSGIDLDIESSNVIKVVIPQNYHNTWNYSIGANYHFSDNFFMRSGIGYDKTPSNNTDRNLQLPDSDRYALALGAHIKATKALGFDIGWTHLFINNVSINDTQAVGGQVIKTIGNVKSSVDIYGLQLVWDII